MAGKGKNPFVVTFGKKPVEYISRPSQTDEILGMFTDDPITNQVYIIRGPRGTGKTVLLADIANRLEEDQGWVVVRCAPTSDILRVIADGLERAVSSKKVSVDASLTIPAIGGVTVKEAQRQPSDTYRIEDALRTLAKRGRKALITVDEVTNTPQMRDFASNLQIWMGQGFPVFFLGTALFERIQELQNVPNLTFLYRAPKIDLTPLDLVAIVRTYQKALDVTAERARELSRLTLGYSFAFQALGYIYWNAMPVGSVEEVLPDFDAMLASAAYSKMWEEMSSGDRELCVALANSASDKVQDVRASLGDDPNRFNQRRIRLKNKGIITAPGRGRIAFSLPRFGRFVQDAAYLYEM